MRLDIVLSILIPDMVSMIDEYLDALGPYCQRNLTDSSIVLDEQRLRPVEERWRERISKRSHGHYTKCPDGPVITDLVSCLVRSDAKINENLVLPNISPKWMDIGIGMLLSLTDHEEHRSQVSSTSQNDSLLFTINTFLDDWHRSSNGTVRSTTINFKVPEHDSNDLERQSKRILEEILIPLLPCQLIINQIYNCDQCRSNVTIRSIVNSIPVSILNGGLDLANAIVNYFSSVSSDLICSTCQRPTTRHIEVVQWPSVLIVHINERKIVAKNKKPPGPLSLLPYSSWFSIGSPSSCTYDLTCFNSIVQVGDKRTMARVTRVKKSWLTNVHKRLIGDGDELRKLYKNSRKCFVYYFELTQQHMAVFSL